MGALRRLLTTLFGLFFLAVSALTVVELVDHNFAAFAVDFLDRCFVYNLELIFVNGETLWLPILVAVALFLIGLLIVIAAFKDNRPPKQLIVSALDGDSVSVSFNAIDNIVKRAASVVKGVSDINTRLAVRKNGLYLRISVSLDSDVTVCEAGAMLRREVGLQLSNILGVEPAEILVAVNKVVDKGALPAVPAVKETPAPERITPLEPEGEVQANG